MRITCFYSYNQQTPGSSKARVAVDCCRSGTRHGGSQSTLEKSVAMLLSRSGKRSAETRSIWGIYHPNRHRSLAREAKYLKVIMDSRLSSASHVNFAINRVKGLLSALYPPRGYWTWYWLQDQDLQVHHPTVPYLRRSLLGNHNGEMSL